MRLNPFAPEWIPPRAQAGVEVMGATAEPAPSFDLANLPAEVITTVISFLSLPRDLASCICACKLLKQYVSEAELCLDMRAALSMQGNTNTDDMTAVRGMVLSGVRKYMPGTVAILLPNALLEDADVDFLLAGLPRLQLLDVSGTRKITHASAAALARANSTSGRASHAVTTTTTSQRATGAADDDGPAPSTVGPKAFGSRRQPLRLLNLQRCFQLHSGSLDEVLATSDLRVLALSHLDLGRWPATSASPGAGDGANGAAKRGPAPNGLQVLALHNCLRLHGAAIAALAAALDGGGGRRLASASSSSSLSPSRISYPVRGSGPGGAAFLLLGGSTLALASFVNSAPLEPPLPSRVSELLESSYKPALTSTAATVQAHLAAARHLVAAALAMPRLAVLELTFFPPPLVQCVRRVLCDAQVTGRPPVEVWDLAADAGDVRRAGRRLLAALRLARRQHTGEEDEEEEQEVVAASSAPLPPWGPGLGPLPYPDNLQGHHQGANATAPTTLAVSSNSSGGGGGSLDALAVATVLRCAVNCSSVTRSTPLHVAAERGNLVGVADLLAAGAVVDARDTAGSSALFLAAEAGHTAVLERLLGAGADPRLGNAAGETPLYISALRGHLGCVQALLAHCAARGIQWQDPELYGDAWTPLHAAAVANRADVAACLLQAAGASGAGELVVVPNKYGQSVLHIAARKGSSQLLRLLLAAGGAAGVGYRDGSGDTPVDVAKKNRHVAALAEFRRLTAAAGAHGAARVQQSATVMA